MEIPLFLAMTAGELAAAKDLPERLGWMACHFSSYATGLSNLPKALPPGSMLMLNDRTPICGHAPCEVAETLCRTAENLKCDCILLDFQRRDGQGLLSVIQAVLDGASCPVGVSAPYAQGFDCPVLVPPLPPYQPLEEAMAPWQGREIWLELTTQGTQITVTPEGSRYAPLPFYEPPQTAHREEALCCHYEIAVSENEVHFHLTRTQADQTALLQKAKHHGVTRGVGLWQELLLLGLGLGQGTVRDR